MDYLSLIKQPIQTELNDFIDLFNDSLSHSNGLLESALCISESVAASVCVPC